MKHLQLFENYTEDELKRFLQKAVKRGDITLNIDIDELASKNKIPKIGTFEYFLEEEGKFISTGDSERMTEYVNKFEELGINVRVLKYLLKDYNRYHKITYLEDDLRMEIHLLPDDENSEEEKIEIEIEKLLDEQTKLQSSVDKFEQEIRKIAKEAKNLN